MNKLFLIPCLLFAGTLCAQEILPLQIVTGQEKEDLDKKRLDSITKAPLLESDTNGNLYLEQKLKELEARTASDTQ